MAVMRGCRREEMWRRPQTFRVRILRVGGGDDSCKDGEVPAMTLVLLLGS